MSQPTRGDVHVNRPLTNISIAFIQDQSRYVADQVFPVLPVNKQSDIFTVYPQDNWFRDDAKERGPGTESAGGGYDLDQSNTYFAKKYAYHKDIDDDVRSNSDEHIDPDRDATIFVTQKMLLRREKQFAADFFQTSIWTGSTSGGDITPGTKWDAAASDPVDDVLTQMEAMMEKTSFRPNVLTVTPQVHRALKSNASILDRIKYTQTGVVTEDILAMLFEVDRYVVARATNNEAIEGASRNMKFIMGTEEALLSYSNPSPGLLTPSAGYIFSWKGMFGAGAAGSRMKSFRMEKLASDRIEGEIAFDTKQIASDLGVFFVDILT